MSLNPHIRALEARDTPNFPTADFGFVAEIDGRPIGAVWASYGGAAIPQMRIVVEPDYRAQGIGSLLIDALSDHGTRVGLAGIALHVENSNPARRLFARKGFVTQDSSGSMLKMLSPTIESVAVYCGSAEGERSEYLRAAQKLGRALARRGIRLVYGGGAIGLMGAVADACLEAGGEVVGVMPTSLVNLEIAHPGLSELRVTENMSERKLLMEELADAYVVLPGGMGTLEELSQVLVRQQLGPYTGPVAFYNVEEYWTPLIKALRHMGEEGFIKERYLDALVLSEDVDTLLDALSNWQNPGIKWRDDC